MEFYVQETYYGHDKSHFNDFMLKGKIYKKMLDKISDL